MISGCSGGKETVRAALLAASFSCTSATANSWDRSYLPVKNIISLYCLLPHRRCIPCAQQLCHLVFTKFFVALVFCYSSSRWMKLRWRGVLSNYRLQWPTNSCRCALPICKSKGKPWLRSQAFRVWIKSCTLDLFNYCFVNHPLAATPCNSRLRAMRAHMRPARPQISALNVHKATPMRPKTIPDDTKNEVSRFPNRQTTDYFQGAPQ